MKKSGKVALGGMLSALSLTFMLFTVFPIGRYAFPAAAGMVLIPLAVAGHSRSAWTAYGAVALLSLLISPDLEAKLLFLSFFGYYPILKARLECLSPRWVEWLIKLVLFNLSMAASYLMMMFIFGLEADAFSIGGIHLPLVFLALGNIVFVMYDHALTRLICAYCRGLHPIVTKIFHLRS